MSEFGKYEIAAGGPDPHMVLSGEICKGMSLEERIWRGGCYIAVYNAPFGEVIANQWPWERIRREPDELFKWFTDNWLGITMRRERRCARRPDWMTQYLLGYAKLAKEMPEFFDSIAGDEPPIAFLKTWDKVLTVPRLGRYVAIKLLEYYRRYCGVNLRHPDIRPRGGYSPRYMLSLLYEEEAIGSHNDAPELLDRINVLSLEAQKRLSGDYGVDLDMFQLQVVLCDYKQSWKSGRQYPGRSVDSELMYVRKAEQYWEHKSAIWDARLRCFPREHLGEVQGWEGPREEAASALAFHKYTWSDLLYDYRRTWDFERPHKQGTEGPIRPPTVVTKPLKPVKRSAHLHQIIEDRLYQSASWIGLDDTAARGLINRHGLSGAVTLWRRDEQLAGLLPWYLHSPLSDGKIHSGDTLDLVASEILRRLVQGERIVVMCHAGRNRSGLITALVLRRWDGITGEQALAEVRHARPRAVANAYFEDYLNSLPVVSPPAQDSIKRPPRRSGVLF